MADNMITVAYEGSLIIKLAWRNIWRNLRRTLITLSAISFGLASIIVFNGFTDGFHTQWIDNYVRAYTGHIQIHKEGYHDDPELGKAIADPQKILSIVRKAPDIEYITTRVEGEGLASTAENSAGVLIRGIDVEDETKITLIKGRVIEGSYLKPDSKGALIGYKLAHKLRAGLGEKVVLMTQAADGTISAGLFRVEGIFKIGDMEFDSSMALITEKQAQKLLEIDGKITEIAVLLKDPREMDRTAALLKKELTPLGMEVFTWPQLMPALTEMIELDDVFMYVILAIVLVVVAFGILNTMLMSIMERTRELGIMMALGTKPDRIVALVLAEAFFIGLIGTAVGIGLGVGGNELISLKGFDLSRWAGAMEFFSALNPVVYPETHIGSLLWASLTIFVTSIITAIYPAVKASRLKPVEAIHFV